MVTDLSLSLHSSGSVAFVGWRATTETVAVYSSAFQVVPASGLLRGRVGQRTSVLGG